MSPLTVKYNTSYALMVFYHAILGVTRNLGFSGFVPRITPISKVAYDKQRILNSQGVEQQRHSWNREVCSMYDPLKASWHSANSSLFNVWSPGIGWGHYRGNHFCMCLYCDWKNQLTDLNLCTNFPWTKGIRVSSNKGPGPLQIGDDHKNAKIG
jgi:hypothetical protein